MRTSDSSNSFRALVAEAEIFERLATAGPEKVRLFADYLRAVGSEFDDVSAEEAENAGKEAAEAGADLDMARGQFFLELSKRPHALTVREAQRQRYAALRSIGEIQEPLSEFHNLAVSFAQDERLNAAFSGGYRRALPPRPHRLLKQPPVGADFETMLGEISNQNGALLKKVSKSYCKLNEQALSLSNQLAERLTPKEQERFNRFQSGWDQRFAAAERHCFLRGVEIALQQYRGAPTPGIDTQEYGELFGLDRLNRRLAALESKPLGKALHAKIGARLYDTLYENACEREYHLQAMALLGGYRLAVSCLEEYDPEYHADLSFSNLLASSILSYIA